MSDLNFLIKDIVLRVNTKARKKMRSNKINNIDPPEDGQVCLLKKQMNNLKNT